MRGLGVQERMARTSYDDLSGYGRADHGADARVRTRPASLMLCASVHKRSGATAGSIGCSGPRSQRFPELRTGAWPGDCTDARTHLEWISDRGGARRVVWRALGVQVDAAGLDGPKRRDQVAHGHGLLEKTRTRHGTRLNRCGGREWGRQEGERTM